MTVRLWIQGVGGALGSRVTARARAVGLDLVDEVGDADAAVLAGPHDAWAGPWPVPSIAPGIRVADVHEGIDVPAGGWFGGLGTLLAAMAVAEAEATPTEVHVAYGVLAGWRALGRASGTLRRDLLAAATGAATARVRNAEVAEPLAEGRRLAWFPAPIGPAHAVAVGGFEHRAPLPAPTVRTWVAVGSLGAELLQAVGRLDPSRGVGSRLARRATAGGAADRAAASDLRWAVVAEVRDADGGIVRSWANGTDPLDAAAGVLVAGARRLAAAAEVGDGSVLALGPPAELLHELADARVLRWSVSRPTPSPR